MQRDAGRGLITHGELHDLFLNRPEDCNGVRLQSVDTAVTYGLSLISRKSDEGVAKRLRKRIDDLIRDGTLLKFAAAHPPISISGVKLQEQIRHEYENQISIISGFIVVLFVVFLAWFHRNTLRKRAEQEIRIISERFTPELTATNQQLELRNREVERANRLKASLSPT